MLLITTVAIVALHLLHTHAFCVFLLKIKIIYAKVKKVTDFISSMTTIYNAAKFIYNHLH